MFIKLKIFSLDTSNPTFFFFTCLDYDPQLNSAVIEFIKNPYKAVFCSTHVIRFELFNLTYFVQIVDTFSISFLFLTGEKYERARHIPSR